MVSPFSAEVIEALESQPDGTPVIFERVGEQGKCGCPIWKSGKIGDDTVDGSKILHQLRLVVYPIIYRVFYIPGGDRRISEPSTVGLLSCWKWDVLLDEASN